MVDFTYPNLFNGVGNGSADIKDKFASTEAPKLKFNFFVKVNFRPAYELPRESRGALNIRDNYLPVKEVGRLNPIINYQDVNYYGFRTKVATRTDFSVFNLTFYDDSVHRSHTIVDQYMKAASSLAESGVSTVNPNQLAADNKQTIIALDSGSELGIIESIEVLHTAYGSETKYTYYNPKITNIMLDELNMAVSETNTVTMSFVYDGYHVENTPGRS